MGGTLDRPAVREIQHGNHATQMCTLAHWATLIGLSSTFSSQRLGPRKCDALSQLFTPDSAETWWQQFFRRLSNCDAPSQPIFLVLLTASLELLGFKIHSRQAISIPKRKMLLVSPLRCLAYRAVGRLGEHLRYRDIVIPLSGSAQWLATNLE